MNGADALTETLLAAGVDVCFANPGTSEMHFVAALDRRPQMRCLLGLSETVVTGAADGYARMANKPAATLLHTGPGLANGLANLHNARRASTPMVNIVGDHATYHLAHDAPLTSDIEGLARPMSHWVGRAERADQVSRRTAEAWRAAVEGPGVATMILPADAAWSEIPDGVDIERLRPSRLAVPDGDRIAAAVTALRSGRRIALMLGGKALSSEGLVAAARIAAATGVRLLCPTANGRVARGRGRPDVMRVPYVVDQALAALADFEIVLLFGATAPVAFFAYPGKPSLVLPPACEVIEIARRGEDLVGTLVAVADGVGAGATLKMAGEDLSPPDAPSTGALTAAALFAIVVRQLPEGAIVVDESVSSGRAFFGLSAAAAPHDFLQLTGGAIGAGIPLATGAAVACPGRKVVNVEADGSGLYSVQGLWTQARERLDVVTVILSNRAYAILKGEMRAVGARQFGRNAQRMLDLDDPAIDWVAVARGFGVAAERVTTVEAFAAAFGAALKAPGPHLIEAVLP